ncbi:hypothetical protein GL2_17800 [Microbulbifer sp. GL-2]|nr:hypothetical protein GL2_17800 [Microbulbifer sp. GL-2]
MPLAEKLLALPPEFLPRRQSEPISMGRDYGVQILAPVFHEDDGDKRADGDHATISEIK